MNVLCTLLQIDLLSLLVYTMHAYSGELSVSVVVVLHSLRSTSPLLGVRGGGGRRAPDHALMGALLNFIW